MLGESSSGTDGRVPKVSEYDSDPFFEELRKQLMPFDDAEHFQKPLERLLRAETRKSSKTCPYCREVFIPEGKGRRCSTCGAPEPRDPQETPRKPAWKGPRRPPPPPITVRE
jgi:hypothetical protein